MCGASLSVYRHVCVCVYRFGVFLNVYRHVCVYWCGVSLSANRQVCVYGCGGSLSVYRHVCVCVLWVWCVPEYRIIFVPKFVCVCKSVSIDIG